MSIKKHFLQIILLTSFVPFVVSIFLLWFIIQNANEKEVLAANQLNKNLELELIDSFHKVRSAAYTFALSHELKEYFAATIDNEDKYTKNLETVILQIRSLLAFDNTRWSIYNSRGHILVTVPIDKEESKITENKFQNNEIGVHLKKEEIYFIIPISYRLNQTTGDLQNNSGYISVILPILSIQKIFPNLIRIDKVTENLDSLNFKASFYQEINYKNNLILFYLYIFLSFVFISIAIAFGLKTLQKKIIDKLLLLTMRVQNEMHFFGKNSANNEIDSLSETFDRYFRYAFFLQIEIKKTSQLAAIGNVAHMIAHDVRKPFTQLKMFVDELKKCNSIEKMNFLTEELTGHISNSFEYVQSTLSDIMDARISTLNLSQNVKIETLLTKAFSNLTLFQKNINISVDYHFNHKHTLNVDEQRIVRVFVNLLTNAFEAMSFSGKIWIYTKEIKEEENYFIEICIGNNNSFIPPENMSRLFEPFFTFQKESGTGLGLAIVQKIVALHKGTISCHSDAEKGVEFFVKLPMHDNIYSPNAAELSKFLQATKTNPTQSHVDDDNKNYDKNIIVVIDDDPLVCQSWVRQVKDATLHTFLCPEDFLNFLANKENFIDKISLVVSDFYFGKSSKLGFIEFAPLLRKKYKGKFLLASDVMSGDTEFLKNLDIIQVEKKVYSLDSVDKI